jgi:histone-lysine N-methyltransferase SETMAR
MLDSIVMMDESTVSFHTPESKMQSKQWTKKGQPGLIKAKVHVTRSKQMFLAFFDNKGLIFTNYVPKGQTVNVNYIVEALSKFLATFKKKRPNMAAGEWFFHWDNAPVHTAAVVKDWMVARDFRLIDHPLYSPDLAPANFFLFPTIKRQLAGKNTDPGDLQDDVGGGRLPSIHRQRGLRCHLQALVQAL